MIIGIGVDIISLVRIKEIYQRHSEHFLTKILTLQEQQKLSKLKDRRFFEYVAGRFAAKEAVAKALGTGIGTKLSWHDITITENNGKPEVLINKSSFSKIYPNLLSENINFHLSISHEKEQVIAFVTLENIKN